MLNYLAISNIPHNIIPRYHLEISLHLTNVAHFKTDIILDISIKHQLHNTFFLVIYAVLYTQSVNTVLTSTQLK